ncbi:MAG: hypothetical protein R3349_03770 [Geminicoccaceae bacterium]|nr:hypothetical protein [Geminicoccaceae bacterium]
MVLAVATILSASVLGSSPLAAHTGLSGNCRHTHLGFGSFCDQAQIGKTCRIDGERGTCRQINSGCQCAVPFTTAIELLAFRLRELFDIALTAPAGTVCDQVPALRVLMTGAAPGLQAYGSDPSFVSTEFLTTIDSLLGDIGDVQATFQGCDSSLPASLGDALTAAKNGFLTTVDEPFEVPDEPNGEPPT